MTFAEIWTWYLELEEFAIWQAYMSQFAHWELNCSIAKDVWNELGKLGHWLWEWFVLGEHCQVENGSQKRYPRVDQLVTEHLSVKDKPDPRGGLHCFCCPNKTWTYPLGESNTLTIVQNKLEMRKLLPPKVKESKNLKKQTTKHYKGRFLNTQKIPCILLCCYWRSTMFCILLCCY